MRLTSADQVEWVGIEGDAIVAGHQSLIGKRADDTLSRLARGAWAGDGPFARTAWVIDGPHEHPLVKDEREA
jgi:hypothetical protein